MSGGPSHHCLDLLEWPLHPRLFRCLISQVGMPDIDHPGFRFNKLSKFVSRSHLGFMVDAPVTLRVGQPDQHLSFSETPSWPFHRIEMEGILVILITLNWARWTWYLDFNRLLALSVGAPTSSRSSVPRTSLPSCLLAKGLHC